MKNLLIEFDEKDLQNILSILEIKKDKTKDRKDALEIQRFITTITEQIKYQSMRK